MVNSCLSVKIKIIFVSFEYNTYHYQFHLSHFSLYVFDAQVHHISFQLLSREKKNLNLHWK